MELSNSKLPDIIVNKIRQFIDIKSSEENYRLDFPNPLLREDIFSLLDKYCIVIYYPLDSKEKNNGFLLPNVPVHCTAIHNFVFINTNQETEKQIFTAAHELGHIWGLKEYIQNTVDNLKFELDDDTVEQIMNRFAAELLMPHEHFTSVCKREFAKKDEYEIKDNTITFFHILRLIAYLMNTYFVPTKAVVWRLYELGFIPKESKDMLCGDDEVSDATASYMNVIIKEEGYSKLGKPTMRKWIQDLPEMLNRLEGSDLVSTQKIEYLRNAFDIPKEELNSSADESLQIETR